MLCPAIHESDCAPARTSNLKNSPPSDGREDSKFLCYEILHGLEGMYINIRTLSNQPRKLHTPCNHDVLNLLKDSLRFSLSTWIFEISTSMSVIHQMYSRVQIICEY